MPKPKGLQWNKLQLKIAKQFSLGKTAPEIVKEGYKHSTVSKIENAIKGGDKPTQEMLTDEYIEKAPVAFKFGQPAGASGKDGQVTPTKIEIPGLKGGPPKTDAVSLTTLLQLIPQVQQLPLTPDIFMSYMCALSNGYEGTMGDWLSLVSRDFWFGRGRDFYAEISGIPREEALVEG